MHRGNFQALYRLSPSRLGWRLRGNRQEIQVQWRHLLGDGQPSLVRALPGLLQERILVRERHVGIQLLPERRKFSHGGLPGELRSRIGFHVVARLLWLGVFREQDNADQLIESSAKFWVMLQQSSGLRNFCRRRDGLLTQHCPE